jgi:glutamyl/glutaminyl-tRNA synthetase
VTDAAAGPSTTRFAPAPTGRLHLGHLANAIFVWGLARGYAARVILRVEDHDRQRCRPGYESALLDDLDRLGIAADEPTTDELRSGPSPFRQSDNGQLYGAALQRLADVAAVYACDCSRSTFAAWREANGRPWSGPGCPGGCRDRRLARSGERGLGAELALRAALGEGPESWDDLLLGPAGGSVGADGDLLVRDRNGNWTYALCVVVDDLRHGVDLVVRGQDLVAATASQIRLGRLLGRDRPPAFAHHPLIRRSDGAKLSKADGATSIGELLDAGSTPAELVGRAAAAVGLIGQPAPIAWEEALGLAGRPG